MNMRRYAALGLTLAFAVLVVPSQAMAAATSSGTQTVTADTLEDFEHQAARIRAEMAPGKRYAELSARELQTIERTLDEIHALLEHTETVSAMNPEQVTSLANLQERANAILTANAKEELICEWVKKTGSNRRQRVCISAYDRDLMREQSRDGFNRRDPSHRNQ